MKHIDKSLKKQQGEQIVTEFLNRFHNKWMERLNGQRILNRRNRRETQ